MSYTSNKKINQLNKQDAFVEALKIPVYDEVTGTKYIDAKLLGNCLLKFSTNGTTWTHTWSPNVTDIRISADGGATWQNLLVGVNGVNPGIWVIFTDHETLPELPALPSRQTVEISGGTAKQWVWSDPSGVWYDENDGSKDTVFQAITVYNGSTWSTWKVNKIKGSDGIFSKTVNVFKVSQDKPAQISSAIGTFENPMPAALETLGWYDEPQDAGSTNIWMSQRTYYADNSQTEWTIPICIEGSNGVYAVWSDNDTKPAAPTNKPVRTNYTSTWAPDPAQKDHNNDPLWYDNPDGHTSKWLALSFLGVNGWGAWQIMQVLGEKGDKGDPGSSFKIDYTVTDPSEIANLNLQPGETVLDETNGNVYIQTSNHLAGPYPLGRGASGINVVLSNETHTVSADAEGVVDPVALGASSTAQTSVDVYAGTVKLTEVASNPDVDQYAIAIESVLNCTAVKGVDNKSVYVDTFSSTHNNAEVVIKVTVKRADSATAVEVLKKFTLSKALRGVAGPSAENAAKFVDIEATSQVFSYDKLGSLKPGSPSSIKLTALPTNLTAPVTYQWLYKNVATLDTNDWVAIATGAELTVSHSEFTTQRTYKVVATDFDSYEASDMMTLIKTYDGLDGADGIPVRVKYGAFNVLYSANPSNWHDTFQYGDKYMIQSTNDGTTWSNPIKIVGEDGQNGTQGNYVSYIFARSVLNPTTPTGTNPQSAPGSIWRDAPHEGTGALWMSSATKNHLGQLVSASWSVPVRLTGEPGPKGDELVGSEWEQGNLMGIRPDGSKVMLIRADEIFNNYVQGSSNPNVNTFIFDRANGLGDVIGVNGANMTGKPAGLYITHGNNKNIGHIGFYNGTRFTSYFDFNGNFYFGDLNGNNAMQWNPTTGIWQVGNSQTGRGIKWDQAAAELVIVGKYFSTNDTGKTRIVIDPGMNDGVPVFQLINSEPGAYGVTIIGSKVYKDPAGNTGPNARGGTVIARSMEAMLGMASSYMIEAGFFNDSSGRQTKIMDQSFQIHSTTGYNDFFQWKQENILLQLEVSNLTSKEAFKVESTGGGLSLRSTTGNVSVHSLTQSVYLTAKGGITLNAELGLFVHDHVAGVDRQGFTGVVNAGQAMTFLNGILVSVT